MLKPLIKIEDWSGENSLNQRLVKKNQTFRSFGMDTYSRKGFITPVVAQELVTGGTASTDISDMLYAIGDSNTYFAINTKLFTLTTPTTITSVHTSGQAGIIDTIKEYKSYLYYAQNTTIGRYDLISTYVDNWQTGLTPSSNFQVSGDGSMYLGNGQYISKYDGTTFTAQALDLQTGWTASCLGNYGVAYLAIGANRNGSSGSVQSKVFLWDRTSPTIWNNEVEIPETTIYTMVTHTNGLWVFAGSNSLSIYHIPLGSFTAIRVFDFENDVPSLYSQTVSLNGADIKDGRIYFGVNTNVLSSTQNAPAVYSFTPELQGFKLQGEFLSSSIDETISTTVTYTAVRNIQNTTNPTLFFSQNFGSTYQLVRDSSSITDPFQSPISLVIAETSYYDAPAGNKLYFTGFGIDTLKRPSGVLTLEYMKDAETTWTTIITYQNANSIGFYTTQAIECFSIKFRISISSNSGRNSYYVKRFFATGKLIDDPR